MKIKADYFYIQVHKIQNSILSLWQTIDQGLDPDNVLSQGINKTYTSISNSSNNHNSKKTLEHINIFSISTVRYV